MLFSLGKNIPIMKEFPEMSMVSVIASTFNNPPISNIDYDTQQTDTKFQFKPYKSLKKVSRPSMVLYY